MTENTILQISEINGYFIGILYSENGIICNTLPAKSKEEVQSSLLIKNISSNNYITKDEKGHAKIIYKLHFDPVLK